MEAAGAGAGAGVLLPTAARSAVKKADDVNVV